jgi:hypothetical protein
MSIICGDCLEEMRKMEDNSISAIITDPPYGLSFMGKGWDHALPSTDCWKEAFRILKPSGFLLAMGGTRTFHRLCCAIEDAGFEIRDCISYLYGSGFPKSSQSLWNRRIWHGSQACLGTMHHGHEKCDGTFKQNAEKWGQAGINIDGCRIEIKDDVNFDSSQSHDTMGYNGAKNSPITNHYSKKGRWPANVILDEEAGEMLDEQSGCTGSGSFSKSGKRSARDNPIYGKPNETRNSPDNYGDRGGASRFFYCAKASAPERNEGLDGLPFLEAGIKNDSGRGFSESDPMKSIQYKTIIPPSSLSNSWNIS